MSVFELLDGEVVTRDKDYALLCTVADVKCRRVTPSCLIDSEECDSENWGLMHWAIPAWVPALLDGHNGNGSRSVLVSRAKLAFESSEDHEANVRDAKEAATHSAIGGPNAALGYLEEVRWRNQAALMRGRDA